MPVVAIRMFRNEGNRTAEQLNDLVRKALVPQLMAVPGARRYFALHFEDGRVGSHTGFEDRTGLGRAEALAREWGASTELGLVPDNAYSGNVFHLSYGADRNITQRGYAIRLYQVSSAIPELKAAADAGAKRRTVDTFPGLVWMSMLDLTGGQVAVLSGFDTLDNARLSHRRVEDFRTKGETAMSKILHQPPSQSLTARVIELYTARG